MIVQYEIDVDVYWRLVNLKENDKDVLIKKILAAEAEYKAEDLKPYYEGKPEKVNELKQKALNLGWTGREMKGTNKPVYEGEVVKIEGTIENFLMEIKQNVAKRELLKLQLLCLLKMKKTGYDAEFEAFKNEKMSAIMKE